MNNAFINYLTVNVSFSLFDLNITIIDLLISPSLYGKEYMSLLVQFGYFLIYSYIASCLGDSHPPIFCGTGRSAASIECFFIAINNALSLV